MFKQKAGLRDAGYTPCKGPPTEEIKYVALRGRRHTLKLDGGEITKE